MSDMNNQIDRLDTCSIETAPFSTVPPPNDSVRYLMTCLVDSVFPAPDSPETMMLWDWWKARMSRYALSAMAKT